MVDRINVIDDHPEEKEPIDGAPFDVGLRRVMGDRAEAQPLIGLTRTDDQQPNRRDPKRSRRLRRPELSIVEIRREAQAEEESDFAH